MTAAIIQHPAAYGASVDDWQHFDLVLGLTEDLLPVVSNPRAVISPDSKLQALGKTPSRYNGSRHAAGIANWTQHVATPAEVAAWSRERDYGICVQSRRVRALDVDVDDADLAARIAAHLAHLGFPVRRRANAAKFLLAFEYTGELHKRRVKCASGMIELLASGQQFIAVGTHPSGVRYEWTGGLPDAFPVLTSEQLEALWAGLVDAFGVEPASTSQASTKAQKLADVVASDPVAQFLMAGSRVKRIERDGRMHIVCPFEDEHTSESGESSTTYFPAHTGGYINGHFQCLHAHCEHRSDQDFLDAAGYVAEDLASEFEAIATEVGEKPTKSDSGPHGDSLGSSEKDSRGAGEFEQLADFIAGDVPQSWLIEDVLPQVELAVIFGAPAAGKSFMVLDMLFSIATGTPWRDKLTTQAPVAYIAAEGAMGVRKRGKAVVQQRGLAARDVPIHFLSASPNLLEKPAALELAKKIRALGSVKLVVIDTLARTAPGADENSSKDMGRLLAHCQGIHAATGATVLLVHHSGKDAARGARGWSGLKGAVEAELEVVKAGDARSLYVSKMKDGDEGAEFPFRLQSIVVGLRPSGKEDTSAVVEHIGAVRQRSESPSKGPKGTIERKVLAQLEELASLSNEAVLHSDLKEAVRAQLPLESAGGRDRRGEHVERAIASLEKSGRILLDGGRWRLAK